MIRAEALGLLPREQHGRRKWHQYVITALNKCLTVDVQHDKDDRQGPSAPMMPSHATTGLSTALWRHQPEDSSCLQILPAVCSLSCNQQTTRHMRHLENRRSQPAVARIRTRQRIWPSWMDLNQHGAFHQHQHGASHQHDENSWLRHVPTHGTIMHPSLLCMLHMQRHQAHPHGFKRQHQRSRHTRGDARRPQSLGRRTPSYRRSGGSVGATKSFRNLIDFIWTGSKWKHVTKDDIPGDITMCLIKGSSRCFCSATTPIMSKKPSACSCRWTATTRNKHDK
jgi:hypothetical protein